MVKVNFRPIGENSANLVTLFDCFVIWQESRKEKNAILSRKMETLQNGKKMKKRNLNQRERTLANSVARYFCTIIPTNIPNHHKNAPHGHKIYQLGVKYSKWPQNMPTYSIPEPSIHIQIEILV
jgi:ABC-type nickel/cobalt efflux system permease component RcnA